MLSRPSSYLETENCTPGLGLGLEVCGLGLELLLLFLVSHFWSWQSAGLLVFW